MSVKDKRLTCYTPPLPSQSFFWGNSTTNRPWPCCLGWNESQDYQILEISFTGRQKNKSFEYDTGCALTFISVLSLRMEGGRERGRGDGTEGGRSALCRWQDWLCVWWMGLSQTVTGLCSIHVDVQYALHPLTSREPFCPDDLQIVSSLAAYGEHSHWGASRTHCWAPGSKKYNNNNNNKNPNYWIVLVQIHLIIYLSDLVKCRNTDWPFSLETLRCLRWPN